MEYLNAKTFCRLWAFRNDFSNTSINFILLLERSLLSGVQRKFVAPDGCGIP